VGRARRAADEPRDRPRHDLRLDGDAEGHPRPLRAPRARRGRQQRARDLRGRARLRRLTLRARRPVLAGLLLAALAACGGGRGPSFGSAVADLGRAPPAALTPAETEEAARLAAIAPARASLPRAVWEWDWRSQFSGVKQTRFSWFEAGAVYAQALGAVDGRESTGPERVAAAEAALAAARRSLPVARDAARLANLDLAALRADHAAAAAAAAAPPAPGQTRAAPMAAEAVAAARAAPEARAALVVAMAAAARADAEAVAAADAGLGVYGGPSISRLRAIAGALGQTATELETLAGWFRNALAGAPGA
jgi:hypothetical protein